MDLLTSWIDAAKQMAQTAIKDRLDSSTLLSGQPLLNILGDTYRSLSEAKRQEIFLVFQSIFNRYQADKSVNIDVFWQEVISHPIIRELAGSVTERLLKVLINKARPGS